MKNDVTSYDTKISSSLTDRFSRFPMKSNMIFIVCSFSASGARHFESALAVS